MSGKGAEAFREPNAIAAYVQAYLTRRKGAYYKTYVDSLGLAGSERILEYGSGPGELSKKLSAALPRGRMTCVDISKVWMRYTRRATAGCRNVDYLQGDLADLEIKDESYDGVLIHFMLHDIPGPQRAEKVNILVRKLRRGGKLYVREPTRENHGMPAGEVRAILTGAGLGEISSEMGVEPRGSPTFQGIYVKG